MKSFINQEHHFSREIKSISNAHRMSWLQHPILLDRDRTYSDNHLIGNGLALKEFERLRTTRV
jgi:hypothetical protein